MLLHTHFSKLIIANLAREAKPLEPAGLPDRNNLAPLFERYSTLERMKVAAAWWLRFRARLRMAAKLKRLPPPLPPSMPVEELDLALLALLRAAQWSVYPHLMMAFTKSPSAQRKKLPSPARDEWYSLRQLDPFMDEHGLLRVGGRLQRAGLTYDQTHPLIVPRRHILTNRLIVSYHVKHLHVGFGHVLALLQERYWIIGGSGTVRHYLRGCIPCRHAKAPLGSQQMAPLPASRFQTDLPAFSYSAVDYFGPLVVKLTTRKSTKRWGALITCLTSRAVHLDLVNGLDAKEFLMTFRRFISVYGSPKEMLSDNGGNFTRADKELKADFKEVDFQRISDGLCPLGINFRWKFNPPRCSHQGGIFERMIGWTRSCLRQMMKDIAFRRPTDPGLRTILKEIEGVINSRPLMPCGTDPTTYDVITPAQLLRPGLSAVPQQTREFLPSDVIRGAYGNSQWHSQEFWRRFKQGYIPLLQKRSKWLHPERNFAVGDLVHVQDKTAPRMQWPLALISEVYPNAADGLVRRVKLKLWAGAKDGSFKTKELVRDVRHICLLEAAEELDRTCKPDPSGTASNSQNRRVTRSMTQREKLLKS